MWSKENFKEYLRKKKKKDRMGRLLERSSLQKSSQISGILKKSSTKMETYEEKLSTSSSISTEQQHGSRLPSIFIRDLEEHSKLLSMSKEKYFKYPSKSNESTLRGTSKHNYAFDPDNPIPGTSFQSPNENNYAPGSSANITRQRTDDDTLKSIKDPSRILPDSLHIIKSQSAHYDPDVEDSANITRQRTDDDTLKPIKDPSRILPDSLHIIKSQSVHYDPVKCTSKEDHRDSLNIINLQSEDTDSLNYNGNSENVIKFQSTDNDALKTREDSSTDDQDSVNSINRLSTYRDESKSKSLIKTSKGKSKSSIMFKENVIKEKEPLESLYESKRKVYSKQSQISLPFGSKTKSGSTSSHKPSINIPDPYYITQMDHFVKSTDDLDEHLVSISQGHQLHSSLDFMSTMDLTKSEMRVFDRSLYPYFVSIPQVRKFITSSLKAVGAGELPTKILTDILLDADLRGYEGLRKLGQILVDITGMNYKKYSQPKVLHETRSTAWVDGRQILGPIVANSCMQLAIMKATDTGIGIVVAKNANHWGSGGYFSNLARKIGLIGMSFTNTSPVIVPTGATLPALGLNPVFFSAPANTAKLDYFVIAGQDIESNKYELTKKNKHLGFKVGDNLAEYAFSLFAEVLCGILSGSKYGPFIPTEDQHEDEPLDLAHCFIAINPKAFGPKFEFRASNLVRVIRNLEPVNELFPVLTPGELEEQHVKLAEKKGGIFYSSRAIESCLEIANKLVIKPLKVTYEHK